MFLIIVNNLFLSCLLFPLVLAIVCVNAFDFEQCLRDATGVGDVPKDIPGKCKFYKHYLKALSREIRDKCVKTKSNARALENSSEIIVNFIQANCP